MKEIWIVPTNPKYLDVIDFFKNHDTLLVKRNQKMVQKDDVVYIYIASPVSQIKYKCHVINEKCSEEIIKEFDYIDNLQNGVNNSYFLIKKDVEFEDGFYKFEELKKNGIGQVQNLARASKDIKDFFNKMEKENEI